MSEDNTLDRLYNLKNQLQERLAEAEEVRARYIKAHDANNWPDLPSTSQPVTDQSEGDGRHTG